jgi:imidazole glycerol phosphate synthase subunit HisF
MDAKRIVPVLRIQEDQVVDASGVHLGHPADLAGRLELEGADGVIFQEWTGTRPRPSAGTRTAWVRAVAGALFIPFALEAAFDSLGELDALLAAGADQAFLPVAASGSSLLAEAALRFGRCHVAASVDAEALGDLWRVRLADEEEREALAWMADLEQRGAGAILLRLSPSGKDARALFQGAARLALPVLFHSAGLEDEWADALLHGADGVAFPAGLRSPGAGKAALAGLGLTLRQ